MENTSLAIYRVTLCLTACRVTTETVKDSISTVN